MRKPTHQPETGIHGKEDLSRFGLSGFIQLREYTVKAKTALRVSVAALDGHGSGQRYCLHNGGTAKANDLDPFDYLNLLMDGNGRKFCVEDIRQSQEWRCGNRANLANLPLATTIRKCAAVCTLQT